MSKENHIISLLKDLQQTFPVANMLISLIELGDIDEQLINKIIDLFELAKNKTTDNKKRTELQKGIDKLKLIKQKELEERQKESNEADELLNML